MIEKREIRNGTTLAQGDAIVEIEETTGESRRVVGGWEGG